MFTSEPNTKVRQTRFSGNGEQLGYFNQKGFGWRFCISEDGGKRWGETGAVYKSKDEILSDLYRFATEYGFQA